MFLALSVCLSVSAGLLKKLSTEFDVIFGGVGWDVLLALANVD